MKAFQMAYCTQGLASMVGYDFRLLGECIYET